MEVPCKPPEEEKGLPQAVVAGLRDAVTAAAGAAAAGGKAAAAGGKAAVAGGMTLLQQGGPTAATAAEAAEESSPQPIVSLHSSMGGVHAEDSMESISEQDEAGMKGRPPLAPPPPRARSPFESEATQAPALLQAGGSGIPQGAPSLGQVSGSLTPTASAAATAFASKPKHMRRASLQDNSLVETLATEPGTMLVRVTSGVHGAAGGTPTARHSALRRM